jgi:hypothetical protein
MGLITGKRASAWKIQEISQSSRIYNIPRGYYGPYHWKKSQCLEDTGNI